MDETEQCELCGCGMLEICTGWQCPECKHIVEAELTTLNHDQNEHTT